MPLIAQALRNFGHLAVLLDLRLRAFAVFPCDIHASCGDYSYPSSTSIAHFQIAFLVFFTICPRLALEVDRRSQHTAHD